MLARKQKEKGPLQSFLQLVLILDNLEFLEHVAYGVWMLVHNAETGWRNRYVSNLCY